MGIQSEGEGGLYHEFLGLTRSDLNWVKFIFCHLKLALDDIKFGLYWVVMC